MLTIFLFALKLEFESINTCVFLNLCTSIIVIDFDETNIIINCNRDDELFFFVKNQIPQLRMGTIQSGLKARAAAVSYIIESKIQLTILFQEISTSEECCTFIDQTGSSFPTSRPETPRIPTLQVQIQQKGVSSSFVGQT